MATKNKRSWRIPPRGLSQQGTAARELQLRLLSEPTGEPTTPPALDPQKMFDGFQKTQEFQRFDAMRLKLEEIRSRKAELIEAKAICLGNILSESPGPVLEDIAAELANTEQTEDFVLKQARLLYALAVKAAAQHATREQQTLFAKAVKERDAAEVALVAELAGSKSLASYSDSMALVQSQNGAGSIHVDRLTSMIGEQPEAMEEEIFAEDLAAEPSS